MSFETLRMDVKDGIATVTISRPQALNALNSQFFRDMTRVISEVKNRNDIKVMIITGEGKAFVAGADIAEMRDMNPERAREFSRVGQHTFRCLELLGIPVIAAVNGFALGGGCELAMACDFRIASSKAKFGQPEVSLGLIPGYAGTQRLPRLAGLGNALFMMMTGDMITADEALRMGLVQKIVEPEQLMDEVYKIAQKIASRGPKAIRLVKEVTRQGLQEEFDRGCAIEEDKFGEPFNDEGKEGMAAFLEKREPKW